MDGGAWWATVHRVEKSWTRLKRLRERQRERERTPETERCSIHFLIRISFSKLLAPKHFFPLLLKRKVLKLDNYMALSMYYTF